MKLFIKIFLWFLVTIVLMFGVIIFVTRTFQTQPMYSRWERSARNQMIIYSGTATQIARAEGEAGLREFLLRLKELEPPRKVDLVSQDGKIWFGESSDVVGAEDIIARTLQSNGPETDFSVEERAIGTAPVAFPDGRRFVLMLQWDRPLPPSLFFSSWLGYLRLAGVLITGFIVCFLLALYLAAPIRKLREATRKLADGDLSTRVADRIGRRRDEIADLAHDFDEMAERIESLVTTQQRLNRDISHELRSPLARLNVSLEIAKQRSNDATLPALERIEKESERLNEMIGRLLTLAKLESGADDFERLRVDLAELVQDVAADADFEARANGRSVLVTAIDPCTVMGNENLLRSAIENVLRNAVRYTAEGTVVDVSLAVTNGKATIRIADHGGGVPEGELENLFRPFYRIGEARERKTGGIGLGLAIAERAVRAHKGKIKAANKTGGLVVEIEIETSR